MYGISFEQWVFMFFIFTVIGWIHETFVESIYHKKFVNRGSLHGPYIPIYGFGGCAMIVFVCPFKDNGFFAFLSGLICCTVLEYFTGWLMETLFHKLSVLGIYVVVYGVYAFSLYAMVLRYYRQQSNDCIRLCNDDGFCGGYNFYR